MRQDKRSSVSTASSRSEIDTPHLGFSLRRLLAGAGVYSLGEVLVSASGFLLIPLYTRVLTPTDYGVVGYVQVFLQVTVPILAVEFHGAQARYLFEDHGTADELGRFLFTINAFPTVVAIAVFAPLTVLGVTLRWTVGSAGIPFWPYMTLVLWSALFTVLANNALGYYRALQRYAVATALQVGRFLGITGFTLFFVLVLDMGALGRIGGLFAGLLLFVFVSFAPYARHFRFQWDGAALRYALLFGAPLVIHALAATVHAVIDRFILERYVDLEQLGIYSLAFTVGNALNLFIVGFNRAFQPSYYRFMAEESDSADHHVVRSFTAWLLIISVVSIIGIVAGRPFLQVFAGPRFVSAGPLFPWIILAVFLGGFYYFFSAPLFYYKKTAILPLITGSSAIANIGLNLLFIPRFGAIGAIVATGASHAIMSALAFGFGMRLQRVSWPYWLIAISLAAVVGSAVFASVVFGR